jgi:hypothetical protein
MGQSSYNPYNGSGGGGGVNYWTIGAGGILQPDTITYPSILALSAKFGDFEFYIDDVNLYLQCADPMNSANATLIIPGTDNIFLQVTDAAGDDIVMIDVSAGYLLMNNTNTAGEAAIYITPKEINLNVIDTAGGEGNVNVKPLDINLKVTDAAGDESVISMSGLAINLNVTDTAGDVGAVNVAPTYIQSIVTDAAADYMEGLQTVADYSQLFNGNPIFTVEADGDLETNQLTITPTVLPVAFAGTMLINDMAGNPHTIPLLT